MRYAYWIGGSMVGWLVGSYIAQASGMGFETPEVAGFSGLFVGMLVSYLGMPERNSK